MSKLSKKILKDKSIVIVQDENGDLYGYDTDSIQKVKKQIRSENEGDDFEDIFDYQKVKLRRIK